MKVVIVRQFKNKYKINKSIGNDHTKTLSFSFFRLGVSRDIFLSEI